MSDLVIVNARLVDGSLDTIGSLLIRSGRILARGTDVTAPESTPNFDAAGAVLCPGLVDIRVSLGEPGDEYRETIASAAQAAAAGGITTAASLPDTRPVIDDPALVRLLRASGEETGSLSIQPYAAATKSCAGAELAELGLLREAGACAFSDGARTIADARILRLALTYARGLGRIVQHPEEPSLASGGSATEGELALRMGLPGIPAAAEAIQIARDLRLARLTGGALHIAHVSTAEAVALIGDAKRQGVDVTCDTAPPYFDLNEHAIADWRTFCKLSPPLRPEADRQAIVAALADGTIDAIASDHRPLDAEDKRLPFAQASPGGTGLVTLLPITLTQVHSGHLGLAQAIALLTRRPAGVLGLSAGTLDPGALADLCLFAPERGWQVRSGYLPGRAQNTPFDGRAVEGQVIATWKAGHRVFP